MAEIILNYFEKMGYTNISINLWHEVRLYVNIKGYKPFSYKVDDLFKISSVELMDSTLFNAARKLIPTLKKNKELLVTQMGSGNYYAA